MHFYAQELTSRSSAHTAWWPCDCAICVLSRATFGIKEQRALFETSGGNLSMIHMKLMGEKWNKTPNWLNTVRCFCDAQSHLFSVSLSFLEQNKWCLSARYSRNKNKLTFYFFFFKFCLCGCQTSASHVWLKKAWQSRCTPHPWTCSALVKTKGVVAAGNVYMW